MKKRVVICFCFLFISVSLFSQRTIRGRVVNEATGETVPGSSVFINSTSFGTTANKDGYFELNNVPAGRHELVISCIGYETNIFSFTSEQLPLNLKIEMKIRVKELKTVAVEPSVEESWDKWGRTFTDHFIGSTPNASQCRIKNEKAIRFRYYKGSNRVIAYCDEPLVIENRALGYNIRYQLEEFELSFKNNSLSFSGYPFFEEMDKGRRGLQRRWKEAREKAFHGSMKHFIQSLYHDSLEQSGYEVRRMKRLPNYEKERVRALYRNSMKTDTVDGRVLTGFNLPKDSVSYYEKVLRQKDYTEIYDNSILSADSLIVQSEGDYKAIYFKDYLYVTYKKELEDEEYIRFHLENRKPVFQRSYIWLLNNVPVIIDTNGSYYPPLELFSMAYWGWSEKTADLLPSDYQPGD
jgi:hypothetical protein